ncbi:MAG: endolytic transglycosylase MltG [Rhodospirillales bacterium]|nr:endolytic transglycosylase MltG [Rhodospirillales bacterium]
MSDKQATVGLKLLLGLFVYLSTTLVVLTALGFWWASVQFSAPGTLTETKLITIERGLGLNKIARRLETEGAINSAHIFIFGTRILGAQSDLKAGEYELKPGMSPRDIMAQLRDGKTVVRRVTIREGLTSFEIVRLLGTVEGLSGEISAIPPEGSLLPNTYDYQLKEDREQILNRLQREMSLLLVDLCHVQVDEFSSFSDLSQMECSILPDPSMPSVDKKRSLKTVNDVLTLASIVEKETGVNEERRRVAGVFINRLKKGIPLQTDPTVIYALTKGQHKNDGKGPLGRRLLKKDLDIDSPYNTYKNAGLPPGPIANPGSASIEAVLNPETHDYIYFVADGTGGHVFAKTLSEHNANVARWRKIRRQNK